MSKLTDKEIDSYLSESNIANLVTLRQDGSPHVSPIWYQYENNQLFMICDQGSIKANNIKKDSRVAISIAKNIEPYKYILIEGSANLIEQGVNEMTLKICIHYQGDERGTKFAKEILSSGTTTIITITPKKFISWKE